MPVQNPGHRQGRADPPPVQQDRPTYAPYVTGATPYANRRPSHQSAKTARSEFAPNFARIRIQMPTQVDGRSAVRSVPQRGIHGRASGNACHGVSARHATVTYMSVAPLAYHWSRASSRAWRLGRSTIGRNWLTGRIWPVVIGSWHGLTVRTDHRDASPRRRTDHRRDLAEPGTRCQTRTAGFAGRRRAGRHAGLSPVDMGLDRCPSGRRGLRSDDAGRPGDQGQALRPSGYAAYWVVTPDVIRAHRAYVARLPHPHRVPAR